MTQLTQQLALVGNIALQALGSGMSHLIAPWFGPVSIVVPFFYSATLLTNMVVFGVILGEAFSKHMRVGTYVIFVSVILLPVVGPNIQEHQIFLDLIRHWYSGLWFLVLTFASGVCGLVLALDDITRHSMPKRMALLLISRSSSLALNLTVSRAFILGISQSIMVTFIVIKILSGAVYTYAVVVQSTAVEQATFVPLNTICIVLTNAITGIIIWEDWRVITSWYGYCCVFVLLGLGCDLLLSGVPLLTSENPEFGKRASIQLMTGKKKNSMKNTSHMSLASLSIYDDHSVCSPSSEPVQPEPQSERFMVTPKNLEEGLQFSTPFTSIMTPASNNHSEKFSTPMEAISNSGRNLREIVDSESKRLIVDTTLGGTDEDYGTGHQDEQPNNTLVMSRIDAWRETLSPRQYPNRQRSVTR